MKKKTWFSLILAGLLAVGSLSACAGGSSNTSTAAPGSETTAESGSGESSGSGGVTLVVMGNSEDIARPYMQTAFQNYEEKTGNKLDLQGIPADNFNQVSLVKFNTGEIPDILMTFGNQALKPYNPVENFYDFSDAFWVDDILDTVKPQAIYEGKVYGLPHWEASLSGTLYNKALFSELGIEIPTTQEEFMQVCADLTEAGVTPLYFAFKDVWPFLYQFALDTIFEDDDLLEQINSNQTTYADIPAMSNMLDWYREMGDLGYLGDMFTANTWDYAVEALGSGDYAMMLGWDTWLYTDLDEAYPGVADDFGIMPAFMNTTPDGTFEGPNACLLLANKNSVVVDAAVDFVNFMAEPENYNIAFDGVNTAPVFKGQTTNIASPQYLEVEANGWIDRVGRPSIAWGNVIGFTQNEGAKCIQEYMIGSTTLEETLQNMDNDRINIAKAQQTPGF